MTSVPSYPFELDRLMGTVVEVGPDLVRANLPLSAADEPQLRHGERVGAGEVGEFVMVEVGDLGLLGRITHVRLPERDRLVVEPRMGGAPAPHPLGTIQLLCTVPLSGRGPRRGIERHPRVGARVFSLHPEMIGWIAEHAGGDEGAGSALRVALAHLPGSSTTAVRITPERLFGRHCAVLGATGGGKSWTLARIVERCTEFDAKVLLLDATGEYHGLSDGVRHVSLGGRKDDPDSTKAVALPYSALAEEDLFALFRPAIQSQAPKLRGAMRSLKLARAVGKDHPIVLDGEIPKAGQLKEAYEKAYAQYLDVVEGAGADFDLEKLTAQIGHECVWPSGWGERRGERDFSKWGDTDEQAFSQCVSLLSRIEGYLAAPEFAPVLRPGGLPSVTDVIKEWLEDDTRPVLRVSLRYLAFTSDIREIVANGIGRHLLALAREGRFTQRPLVVCLDEAHQFLNKWLGDEFTRYPLDAFDLIAKEGRKYSLSLCLATQRPRDIPEAVLGQMGTLLVHRLTNDADRHVVERAAGDLDRSAAEFLPTLSPGEALLLGVDYPIPLIIAVTAPTAPPDSRGPDYQHHWQPRPIPGGEDARSPEDETVPEPEVADSPS
jgi:hypothetical protein